MPNLGLLTCCGNCQGMFKTSEKLCFSVLKNRSWFCIAPGSRSEASSWLNQNSVQLHSVALSCIDCFENCSRADNIFFHRAEVWLWTYQCLSNLEHSFRMSMQYVVQSSAQHCLLRPYSSCILWPYSFLFWICQNSCDVRAVYFCILLKCSNPAQ